MIEYTNSNAQNYEYVPGEIIVQTRNFQSLDNLKNKLNKVESRAQTTKNSSIDIQEIQSSVLPLLHIKTDESNIISLIRELKDYKEVIFVQRNKVLQKRNTPNDPDFIRQWTLLNPVEKNDSRVPKAWDITTGGVTALGDTIVVAIIDDGVGRHDDLVGNLWINHKEIPGDGIDNDGNGFIDDYYGWNSQNNNDLIFTDERHGTAIAGIVGAKGNNNLGVTGINWNVKLMIIDMGNITEANALRAYSYVYEMRKLYNESNGQRGAFIVVTNSSWGIDFGKAKDAPIWCDFYDKLGSIGILNCVASVNRNIDIDIEGDLPTTCTSEYLIGITNINRTNEKNNDASFGKKSIDLGAYGQRAFTTTSNNRYAEFVGTSSATPHVVGAIALAYSVPCKEISALSKNNPAEAARLLKHLLLSTVSPNASLTNKSASNGVLNIGDFIEATQKLCSSCPIYLVEKGKETLTDTFIKIKIAQNNTKTDIRMRHAQDSVWTYYFDVLDGQSIPTPQLCVAMEYQVRHQCEGAVLDSFGYSRYFFTYGCCEEISNLNLEYRNNSIQISNTLPPLADYTFFEYRLKDSVTWSNLKLNGSTIINGITDCQLFEYRAYNSCLDARTKSDTIPIGLIASPCGNCTSSSYCTPSNVNNRQEWIKEVAIGSNSWTTEKGTNGYTSLVSYKIPLLRKGSKYPIRVSPGFLGTTFRQRFYIYLDSNQDGIFQNSELILSSQERLTEYRDSLLIPNNALPGITRVRVIMSFAETNTPCETNELFGEVEDYCINIEEITSTPSVIEHQIQIHNLVKEDLFLNVSDFTQNIVFEIFDQNGRSVKKGKLTSNHIDCSQLLQGVYLIQFNSGKMIQAFKFIKI